MKHPVRINHMFQIKILILGILFVSATSGRDQSGEALYREGRYQEAREYYIKKSQERGIDPEIQFGYGSASYQLEDVKEAMNAFKSAANSDDPELQSKAYYNLGIGYYGEQDFENSLAAYKKALELNPSDIDAKMNYELLKRKSEQEQEENQTDQDQGQNQKNNPESQQNEENGDQKDSRQDQQQNDENNRNQEQNNQQSDDRTGDDDKKQQDQPSDQENKQPEKQSPEYRNAEAILNALKKDEKINQKRQIARGKTRTLEKDW